MPIRHETTTADQLCTPAEAMELLRVSRKTLLRYEAAGRLNPVRLPSGHRRYRVDELDALKAAS